MENPFCGYIFFSKMRGACRLSKIVILTMNINVKEIKGGETKKNIEKIFEPLRLTMNINVKEIKGGEIYIYIYIYI